MSYDFILVSICRLSIWEILMKKTFGIGLAIAISASVCNQGAARAGEVKLLSALVMKPALTDLAGNFERTSGHKLTIAYDSAGAVTKRIQSGEIADVAITQKPAIDNLLHDSVERIVPLHQINYIK